ncbi:DNA cytosine methyltransferase [Anaerosporomusa subterranea]|uniref:Cytosine-specific methyltransferase n=1 Tax=Anaerosporomusa subterranea TaxID=1794912 RepID=A0A154BQE4_ANASB|nr:DNA (cytosine-5-)-methyltransferase [Anaerosporomusa subterranea]KYZ76141.1 DNA cytosine methyltransferase [Anaerosporomusa subterranea]
MKKNKTISATDFADILSVSKRTLEKWEKSGKYIPEYNYNLKRKEYKISDIADIPEIKRMLDTNWHSELETKPKSNYKSIELFAGAGGLALGLETAGFESVLLNEIDHDACSTLRTNRPEWNVVEGDIAKIDFSDYKGKIDFLSGGFPCQAFSYAGNKLGFDDTRGTLFFQLARAIRETAPKVFLAENVRGLLNHDNGRTMETIKNVIAEIGYTLIEPRVLKAIHYQVPQKRERLFLIGIRNDFAQGIKYLWPSPYKRIMTLRDALFKGDLYDSDVPNSIGQKYPPRKKQIMDMVPMGGYWRDLPIDIQKEYMQKSFYLGGGKTGIARRLSMDEPSLTLTCAPAQKQTERCHPLETRPLTIREYARIQTFPDSWVFAGALNSQYKQIGNAVPVNLAYAVGRSLIRLLNDIYEQYDIVPKEACLSNVG